MEKKMLCWKCGKEMDTLERGKISFREVCQSCFSWLHCCKNCKNYKPGLPNDCAIAGTEYIAEREAANFCEEFVLLGKGPQKRARAEDIEEKLFGEKPKTPQNKGFEDLFK